MKKFLLFAFLAIWTFVSYAVSPSGSLPVMYVNTDNSTPITSKVDYLSGSYWLDAMGVDGVSSIGSADAPLRLQIKGRGNYTWAGFDKKPYRLKLDKKAALLGMKKSKHFALLAHADDSWGFMRNATGFQLSRMAGMSWTPSDQPVEVVLNGDYIGLYFLTETIRVDADRVNIQDYDTEFEDFASANPGMQLPWQDEYLTGGWLVEVDNYDDENQVRITSIDPYNNEPEGVMRITYDTPADHITEAHREWLRSEFEALDRMIVDGNRDNCEWADKIDITDLARFFVINQIVLNTESFHGSCKLWRQRGLDSKWHYGPVWDFGSAFTAPDCRQMLFDASLYSSHWLKCMYEYPAFRKEVERVYAQIRSSDFDALYTYMDAYASNIASAARADRERWQWQNYGNEDVLGRCNDAANYIKSSVAYLDKTWHYNSGNDTPDPDLEAPCDMYLRCGDIGWGYNDDYKFTYAGGGYYTLTLSSLGGEFKIADTEWGVVNYGSSSVVVEKQPVTLVYGGDNCRLEQRLNDVNLKFHWPTKVLTINDADISVGVVSEVNTSTVEYYNLQGMRISAPLHDQIYVRRADGRSQLVKMHNR